MESKAEDPILSLRYFKERQILLTLILGFITGVGLMAVVFIPQFAENILKIKTGNGGYLVTLMSVFAGLGSPLGGKLIDKYSAKLVTVLGMICTALGTFFLAFYTTAHPSFLSIMIGLVFVGFGMGFTMGTPLNYLMLSFVSESESASALSTLSLVRSIGIAVSPNIMINFIAEAGKSVQGKIMAVMPEPPTPTFPGSQYVSGYFDMSKMTSGGSVSSSSIEKLQSADVTTVVDVLKDFTSNMLDKVIPTIKDKVLEAMSAAPKGVASQINLDKIFSDWKLDYLNKIEGARATIENTFQTAISTGYRNMFIAAGVIAIIGLVAALLLKNKKKTVQE